MSEQKITVGLGEHATAACIGHHIVNVALTVDAASLDAIARQLHGIAEQLGSLTAAIERANLPAPTHTPHHS